MALDTIGANIMTLSQAFVIMVMMMHWNICDDDDAVVVDTYTRCVALDTIFGDRDSLIHL